MIVAPFGSVARFVWTRHRKLLLILAAIYLALFLGSPTLAQEEMQPFLPPILSFLRLASIFLPLILFVGTANLATLDLGGRPGQFPRIFFTLPIKSREMVLPFIVYAIGTAAVLWLLGTLISDRRILMFGPPGTPIGAETIAYWAPFWATSLVCWLQALIWRPFPKRWLKFVALFGIIIAYTTAVFLYAIGVVTQAEVIAASLVQIPLAFLVATRGVALARRGEGIGQSAVSSKAQPLRNFSGALDAQTWFEARVHRWHGAFVSVPPLLLLLLFIGADVMGAETQHPAVYTAIARLDILMFVWLAISVAVIAGMSFGSYRHAQWQMKNPYVMPAFFAALPLSTSDLAWAKLTAATTRVLWLSIVALLACGLIAGRAGMLDEPVLRLWQAHGNFAAFLALLIPAGAVVLLLIAGATEVMGLTLDGRRWSPVNLFHIGRYLIYLIAGVTLGRYWGAHHVPPPGLADAIRIAAIVKLAVLAVIVYQVRRQQLFSWTRLGAIGLLWLATVASTLTTVLWLLPENRLSLPTAIALLVLLIPVLSTAAAPLALQLNRTR